ncbi:MULTISPECIES: ABC transporter ATP-binding protein [Enterobacteriaceae]|uniref:ABC transporter ATP-binding protein n=1 Tax=Enterobacteriaceae TaxID=543 RepID=UPI0015DBD41C|nr:MULTISPECIES: ABC transporter ATP-binding protein [unclassified Klebsiella]HAT3952073.1 ABC transporter ATP-binding protein [Kluyvera ascorbata]BBR59518.1 sugar ABC transporter ATP-binding protein [Klebsiella sp. WP4-W18-ESBL-05]BBS91146.1 sugar ABC transporter ATP-binding protein [Klebsiella sp. WP7-S18-CRE-02]BBS96169.1 sugar ABC transporter ATP-binding protein [Klebsiella sp. WP7-S18-CRE-03]BBT01199.1 sugar ABC transporter ATP-binding protein [Klebsiella sp. WP7-S18-ESBL-04]
MNSNTIITVEKVSKTYKSYSNKKHRLIEWLTLGKKKYHKDINILSNISFKVCAGESVGILGMNGAGKSTLLKIITGTTNATTGVVNVNGRVAALLELGMGFHPDFTGRDNVFMSGQLMGLNTSQLAEIMPQIEEFAEIGDYIDQPVRTYSSGMQIRLAFAVATAVRPELLIVDEALSVGDAYFQSKCFNRIRKFKEKGTTLLIVSHDQAAIANICSRAILLDKGTIVADGAPTDIMNLYNAKLSKTADDNNIRLEKGKSESGNKKAIIDGFYLEKENGTKTDIVEVADLCSLCFTVTNYEVSSGLTLGFHIRDRLGNIVFGTNTLAHGIDLAGIGTKVIKFKLNMNIGIGEYSISAALHKERDHYEESYHWLDGIGSFNVIAPGKVFVGSAWLNNECSVYTK